MIDKSTQNTDCKIGAPKKRPQQSESPIGAMSVEAVELSFVRNKLENFQTTVLKDVAKRMSCMIDDVMQEIRQHELQSHEFRDFARNPRTSALTHRQRQRQAQGLPPTANTWDNRVTQPMQLADDTKSDQVSHSPINTNTKETAHAKRNGSGGGAGGGSGGVGGGAGGVSGNGNGRRALPDKVFVTRESYLTALLEVDHMKTIYHIFYIILLMFLMNSLCHDYFVEGRVNFGLGTFKSGLQRLHYWFGYWLLQHVFVFTLYYALKGWATVRHKLAGQPSLQSFWSHSCLILYVSAQLVFGYAASHVSVRWDLAFVSACVLLLETTRLLMKMHAFTRVTAARMLSAKSKSGSGSGSGSGSCQRMPPFSCYLYFLFAPTLIYRDSYPRTTQIRWKFAVARFLEVVAVAFLYSYIHERHIKVHFGNYGREELNAAALIVKLFGMLMPSIVIFLGGFYLILHSWLNFTAELLRFGDRMFYKDWWTASTYDAYYRNWNVVVHDWLYEYIYKDCYNYLFRGSKMAAGLMVFAVSALVHEQVLGVALQLFFPVMFVFFGVVGVALVFITRKAPKTLGNIFLWFSLIAGNGMMISLYCMEYYARQNCPRVHNSWTDWLMPSVWSCYRG